MARTFLYDTGPVSSLERPELEHARQTYSSARDVEERRKRNTNENRTANNLSTPPDNIGPRSTPNYANLAAQAVYPLSGVHGTGQSLRRPA